MKKKLLFTIISLIVVIGTVIGLIVPSFSAPEDVYDEELNNITEPVRAGAVGEVYWKVTNNILYLRNNATSGYAKVDETNINAVDYNNYTTNIPWGSSAGTITKVVIENEIRPTNTNYYFYNMSKLATIENIANLNTSNVTDMERMFYRCSNLTQLDLSNFDTSKVTNMNNMFCECSSLSALDLSGFNTSQVTDMRYMFDGCSNLTQLDLRNINTSKVTDMRGMFQLCSKLETFNLISFDTSKVTDMGLMFYGCRNITQLDLSSFNTSQVTNMGYMFDGCSSLSALDLSNFNTSQVTNMGFMFYGCSNLTQLDLSNINTSKVTDMGYMFSGCSSLSALDLSNFNTSQVTNMRFMFDGCSNLTQLDLSNINTSKVTDMRGMFESCSKLETLNLISFDTSKVTEMGLMFYGCSNLTQLDLSNINTSKVTDMGYMFSGCSSLTKLDISSFDVSKVTDMIEMYRWCQFNELRTPKTGTTSTVTNLPYTMYDTAGTSYTQSTINRVLYKIDPTIGRIYWKVDNNILYLRNDAQSGYTLLKYNKRPCINCLFIPGTIPVVPDWYPVVDGGNNTIINQLNIQKVIVENKIKLGIAENFFADLTQLQSIENLSNMDMSNVKDASRMFSGCSSLRTLDLSSFNTSQIEEMDGMFYGCSGLSKLDISNFDVSKVTNMNNMYGGCQFNQLRTPKTGTTTTVTYLPYTMYDTAGASYTQSTINKVLYKTDPTIGRIYWKVTNNVLYLRNDAQSGYAKVDEAKVNTADYNNYTTNIPWGSSAGTITKVVIENEIRPTKTNFYFYKMYKLATIENIANLNTSNVTNMRYMFSGCSNLTQLNLSNFDTSKVTDMSEMFYDCSNLIQLDLRSFNTSNVTNMNDMFSRCINLTQLDLRSFNTSQVTYMNHMFSGCSNLKTLNISNFDTSKVTDMYAMFSGCSNLTQLDLRSFNTSKVTDMRYMFSGCSNLTQLDLSNFDTSKVTNMYYMFYGCSKLTQLDLSSFNVSKVTEMGGMYNGCKFTILHTPKTGTKTAALPYTMYDISHNEYNESTIDRVLYKELGVYWKIDNNILYLRSNITNGYEKVDESKVDLASSANYTTNIPWGSSAGTITKVVIENEIKPTKLNLYFYNMSKLTTIENIANINTSNVTSMRGLFYNCNSIEKIDLSNFDTKKVIDMGYMFYSCSNLKTLDISNFDISKITNYENIRGFLYKSFSLESIKTHKIGRNDIPLGHVMKDSANKLYIHMPINKTITLKKLDLVSSDYTGIGEVNSVKYGNVENLTYNINSGITNSSKYSNKIDVSNFVDGNNLWINVRNSIILGYPYDGNNIYAYAKNIGVNDSQIISVMKNATQKAINYYITHAYIQTSNPDDKIALKIIEEVNKKNTLINNEIGVYVALPNDKTKQNKIVLNSSINPIVISKVDNNSSRVIGARLRIVNKDGSAVSGGSINGNAVSDVVFESANINTLVNLPLGEYILKEVYTPTGYKRASDISFNVTSSNINTGQYIQMIDEKTTETTRDLKISNKLEGKYAQYDKEFRISININTQESRNLNATIYRKNNTEESIIIKTKEESIFTLAHEEYIIIKDVPQGVGYSVVQLEDTGYIVTYKEASSSNIINSNIYNGEIKDYSDTNELYINNTRQIAVETGIIVSIIPFITLLIIASILFVLYKKNYIGVNDVI